MSTLDGEWPSLSSLVDALSLVLKKENKVFSLLLP
jgi:hypothetical protein